MKYLIEINTQLVEIDVLLKHYDIEEVFGYCLNCPNYNKNWSCPPHDFNEFNYIKKYKYAYIISGKIATDKLELEDRDDVSETFEKARREFSDLLMEEEKKHNGSVALIAGNCYQCDKCTKADGEPCILKEKLRYSLESLGLKVSEITKNILHQEILWSNNGIPEYLLTVGALLIYDKKALTLI